MSNRYSFILLLLVGLLIGGAFLLILFRNPLLNYLEGQMSLNSPLATTTTVAVKDTLDPELLKLKRFTALTANVVNFDFDNICWRPDTIKSRPEISDVPDTATTTATTTTVTNSRIPLSCQRGNDLPFLIKLK